MGGPTTQHRLFMQAMDVSIAQTSTQSRLSCGYLLLPGTETCILACNALLPLGHAPLPPGHVTKPVLSVRHLLP